MKRIAALVITMLLLWTSICFAENWEQIRGSIYLDSDSVQKTQVDYNTIIKCVIKYDHKDDGYSLSNTLINIDNKTCCFQLIISYDNNGKEEHRFINNPKNSNEWSPYEDDSEIGAIAKRVQSL